VSLWNVKRVGEPASDEYVTDAKYPEHFKKAVDENDCVLQLVFNLDETDILLILDEDTNV
jgi:hypothetical protein